MKISAAYNPYRAEYAKSSTASNGQHSSCMPYNVAANRNYLFSQKTQNTDLSSLTRGLDTVTVSTEAKNAIASRPTQSAMPSNSFAGYLDKAMSSQKSQQKQGMRGHENLAATVADLKAYNREVNERTSDAVNYDKWLPENLEKLHEIWAKMDKFDAEDGNPNPHTRSDASNKKMWDYHSQIAVLEVYGESKEVTDEMLLVGAAAYREGEREWGAANGWQTEQWAEEGSADSLLQMVLKTGYGDPEELKKQMDEWKSQQLVGNGSSQTKKEFTQHMDKLLGRGQIGQAKSPEEQIKELNAKIKTLQSRLSELAADQSMQGASGASQAESLNAQINSLHAQIAEVAKMIS